MHNPQRCASTVFLAGSLWWVLSAQGLSQEKPLSDLQENISRTGIFFRADAPSCMRNREDFYLPIALEIINGVETTAHSTGTAVAHYVRREPLKLEGVNLFVKPAGTRRQFAAEPMRAENSKDFSFDARTGSQPLSIADRMKKTLEIPRQLIEAYLNRNYIGGPFDVVDICVAFRVTGWPSQNIYLRVRLNSPPLPQIPNWYRGDVHYHSAFTDNPAERGHPLNVTKQAALQAGLNWILLTDHSTDLDPEKYAAELREVAKYRDGRFLFIRGEELTVASGKTTMLSTVHLVAIPSPDDPDKGFPTPASSAPVILTGDGSLASPALPLNEALQRIVAAGGFAYAAHPYDPISPLLGGGSWDIDLDFLAPGQKQLRSGLVGLEPWNRATTQTADNAQDPFCLHRDADPSACFQPDKEANHYTRLERGIELGWRPLLVKGLSLQAGTRESPGFKVFLAAGSDAHGDFNYEATKDVVDFLSKPARGLSGYAEDNALGKLSTVVYCPAGMGRRGENVLQALRAGRSVLSDGPLLVAGFDSNASGSLDDPEDVGIGQEISSPLKALPPLQLYWVSSQEFGPLESLRLLVGSDSGESKPEEITFPSVKGLASEGLYPVDLQKRLEKASGVWGYVRLEARTRNSAGEEFRCYTNPIWVRVTEP